MSSVLGLEKLNWYVDVVKSVLVCIYIKCENSSLCRKKISDVDSSFDL